MEDRLHLLHQVMLEYDYELNREEGVSRWVLPNLLVKVGEDGKGAFLGIVRDVMIDGKCLVAVADSEDGEHVVANESELTMVVPNISDDVKIVSGEFRHMTGKLVHIIRSRGEGLVLLDDVIGLKYFSMELIGKLAFIKEKFNSPPELPPVILLPWREDIVHGSESSQGGQEDDSLQGKDGDDLPEAHGSGSASIKPEDGVQGTSEQGKHNIDDETVQREAHTSSVEPIQTEDGGQGQAEATESEKSAENLCSSLPQPE